ncbi:MAG: hypothetical protein KKD44_26250 [Proteobacteria bacterium]|nr:hypothetical protein [Pseudomonadota bacterium]
MCEECNEIQKNYGALKRIHESVNLAVISLEAKVQELTHIVLNLEARNEQLVKQMEIKDVIVHQSLEESNKQNNIYLEEINMLREEIRRMNDVSDGGLACKGD